MKVLMYGYARPEYVWLTLNSLFYNSDSAKVYLTINGDRPTMHRTYTILDEFIERYPDRFNCLYLRDNFIQNAVDLSYQMAKPEEDEIICITEDDIIIPCYFKGMYGDFLAKMGERVSNNRRLIGESVCGVSFSEHNCYENGKYGSLRENLYNGFYKEQIGTWYMCLSEARYRTLSKQFKRVPHDTELRRGLNSETIDNVAYHLGWNRQIDYPAYYDKLYEERVTKQFQDMKKPPETNPWILYGYVNGKSIRNEEWKWSWNES